MVLLRRLIGDALRSRRQGQHRTLREVSTAANVSLGYLSEIERGQKEASSELLGAICDALGAQLSELLREVSDTVALAEQMDGVLVPVGGDGSQAAGNPATGSPATGNPATGNPAGGRPGAGQPAGQNGARGHRAMAQRGARTVAEPRRPVASGAVTRRAAGVRKVATDGNVTVSVRLEPPLKATLRSTRTVRPVDRGRDVVCVA